VTCKHDFYKQGSHLTADNALKSIKAGINCWMSKVISNCQDCGADLSKHKVVEVKTADKYLRELNLDARRKRRGKHK